MGITWCEPWRAMEDDRHRVYIERELGWELSHFPDHALSGVPIRVVGCRNVYDDFIVQLDDGRTFGHVRLTWGRKPPFFALLGDSDTVSAYLTKTQRIAR